ncbi:MAG: hypothetical protein AAGE52_02450 [Myxococcota bacterium]
MPPSIGVLLAEIVIGATLLSSASAQSAEVDLGRVDPPMDQDGFLSFEGTATPGSGRGNIGLHTGYALQPAGVAVDHRVVGVAFAQVGVGGRVAIGLRVPTLLYADEGRERAVGDPTLVVRARIFGRPTTSRFLPEGSGLALRLSVRAPAGQERAQISEDQLVLDAHLLADWRALGFGFGLMAGWRFRPERREVAGVGIDDELHFGLALELPFPFYAAMSFPLEVRGAIDASAPFARSRQTAVEGLLGIRLRLPRVALTLLLGRRHSPGLGNPRVRATLTLTWKPRVWDLDGDGIRDRRDSCPHEPEDSLDRDGCPGSSLARSRADGFTPDRP